MALAPRNPNTIYLGGGEGLGGEGGVTQVNTLHAVDELTPGFLLELHDDGNGNPAWGVHDSADDPTSVTVALDYPLMNRGIDDVYAIGDLVLAGVLKPGSMFYGIVPSGQDIDVGERLQSNGDGKLKTGGSGSIRFVSHTDTGGAVTADTRIRVEVL